MEDIPITELRDKPEPESRPITATPITATPEPELPDAVELPRTSDLESCMHVMHNAMDAFVRANTNPAVFATTRDLQMWCLTFRSHLMSGISLAVALMNTDDRCNATILDASLTALADRYGTPEMTPENAERIVPATPEQVRQLNGKR